MKPAHNSTFAIAGLTCFYDRFVVNGSADLRINPESIRDAENRHIRQTRNRIEKV